MTIFFWSCINKRNLVGIFFFIYCYKNEHVSFLILRFYFFLFFLSCHRDFHIEIRIFCFVFELDHCVQLYLICVQVLKVIKKKENNWMFILNFITWTDPNEKVNEREKANLITFACTTFDASLFWFFNE